MKPVIENAEAGNRQKRRPAGGAAASILQMMDSFDQLSESWAKELAEEKDAGDGAASKAPSFNSQKLK